MDNCFRGGVRSKGSAREGGALRQLYAVYCAKHLYTLDNEMCSTCAKRGWRDVRCARHPARTDEPHANRNSRVPGASSTRTGLSRARSTSMAPSVVSTVSRGEYSEYAEHGGLAIFKCRATDKSNPLYVKPRAWPRQEKRQFRWDERVYCSVEPQRSRGYPTRTLTP